MHDECTSYDVHAAQFSQEEAAALLDEPPKTLSNWVQFGYVKPDYFKDPRGGPDRRRFSITELVRMAIIRSATSGIGLKPSQAVQIADFAMPFLNERFDRDAAQELISPRIDIMIFTWLDNGQVRSGPAYRCGDDPQIYTENPEINPDAKPMSWPAGSAVYVPLTRIFNKIFLAATAMLARQGRGGLDKFRRSVDA